MKSFNIIFKLVILTLLFKTSVAYAYFDPGTASFIIQSIIAFLGSVIVFMTNPIRYIKNFIKKFKEKKNNDKKKSSD